MEPLVLIVGDYPLLRETRAAILWEWLVQTTSIKAAPEVIAAQHLDLIIFCQTVHDDTMQNLLALAALIHPNLKVLAFSNVDQARAFIPFSCNIGRCNPEVLRSMAAELLGPREAPMQAPPESASLLLRS